MSIETLPRMPRWLSIVTVCGVGALAYYVQIGHDGGVPVAQDGQSTCQSIDYTYGTSPTLRGRGVTGAEVTGVAPVCAGRTMRLTFLAQDGSPLAVATARVEAPLTTLVLRSPGALSPEGIDTFDMVVEG